MQKIIFRAGFRKAFTILELMVVVAIVGALIAMLLPALMAARETARCMHCRNNLREVGIAVQQHHDALKRLPSAWKTTPDGTSGYGWVIGILPFIEEAALAQSINCKLPLAAPQHDAARHTDVPIMRCPSDISDNVFDLFPESKVHSTASHSSSEEAPGSHPSTPLLQLPIANYMGVFGTLEADETVPAPSGDGAIVSDRVVKIHDLVRGASHTLLIGERTAAMVPSTWYGVNFKGEDAACRLVGSAITSPNCEPCDECEFGSRHSGGANFAWADGHVTLVLADIDRDEYQRLSQRRLH